MPQDHLAAARAEMLEMSELISELGRANKKLMEAVKQNPASMMPGGNWSQILGGSIRADEKWTNWRRR